MANSCPIMALALAALTGCQSFGQATADASTIRPPVHLLREWLELPRDQRPAIEHQQFAAAPISRPEANAGTDALWQDHLAFLRARRAEEWKNKSITIDGKTMRFEYRVFGDKPQANGTRSGGRSLFISMHGGGGAPAEVNDQQWQNQIRLYEPAEGVYLAPRAPTDSWNLWHEAHIDALFDRLIEDAIAFEDVDPDRVYLMGYSAGGDGVYQLGPRMADRFAAVAMMAGHPNEASPVGLRNLPFIIQVGEKDSAFNRNAVARQWGEKLDALQSADSQGYIHEVIIREGLGHWMNRLDAEALPWMAAFTRTPPPTRVVWRQDDVTHDRFYWLRVDADGQHAGAEIAVSIDGQRIVIERSEGLTAIDILLSDALIDLDRSIEVVYRDIVLYSGTPIRTIGNLAACLAERADLKLMFPTHVRVTLPENAAAR